MRAFVTFIIILLTPAVLSACGRGCDDCNHAAAVATYQTARVESLQEQVVSLQNVIQENETTIQDLQQGHALDLQLADVRLQNIKNAAEREANLYFWHGHSAAGVRDAFMQSEYPAVAVQRYLGFELDMDMLHMDSFLINPRYLIVREGSWSGIYLFFAYLVCHETGEIISWTLLAYDLDWNAGRIVTVREPAPPRKLTSLSYVTLRFYEFPYVWDEFPYVTETIAGELLWEESIRLMGESGVHVRDLWLYGDTLYVDFMPSMVMAFRSGLGSIIWAERVIMSFESLPGVERVVFTLDGQEMPGIYNGWCMNTQTFPWWDGE